MVNQEHQAELVAALRSGKYEQTRKRLATLKRDDGTRAYCCIGLATHLAGATFFDPIGTWTGDGVLEAEGAAVESYYVNDLEVLAPPETVAWLCDELPDWFDEDESREWHSNGVANGFDFYLDVPDERPLARMEGGGDYYITLSTLNDEWGFTFPQIADMIEHFGILKATN